MEFEFIGDEIFLLSNEEYETWKKNIPQIQTEWWLRSTDSSWFTADYVLRAYGGASYDVTAIIGVRPALKIPTIDVGASVWKYGTTWVGIAPGIGISEMPIGFEPFDMLSNLDYSDYYPGYENSYIRKWLRLWLEERLATKAGKNFYIPKESPLYDEASGFWIAKCKDCRFCDSRGFCQEYGSWSMHNMKPCERFVPRATQLALEALYDNRKDTCDGGRNPIVTNDSVISLPEVDDLAEYFKTYLPDSDWTNFLSDILPDVNSGKCRIHVTDARLHF